MGNGDASFELPQLKGYSDLSMQQKARMYDGEFYTPESNRNT